jgi:uncharacterized protein YecT (DUF1311 family)
MHTNTSCIFRITLNTIAAVVLLTCSFGHASQAGKAYNDATEELNATYAKVLVNITDPKEKKLLMDAQEVWVKFRDAEVAFHGQYFPGSKGGLFIATDMTERRIKELKLLLTEEAKQEHEVPFTDKSSKDTQQGVDKQPAKK